MLKLTQKTRGRRFSPCRKRVLNLKNQAGFTLIEAMIALALSVVVIASMVALMSNSLGTTTRIIEMSQLTDELRNTMSMMSRDVRRANYSVNSLYCYGFSDCAQAGDITINGSNDCFSFLLDRESDSDGTVTNNDAGGFRRVTSNGVGMIEIWVGDSSPNCAAPVVDNDDWVPVTDPGFVDITTFTVNDNESFTETSGATISQRARHIQMILQGELILDDSITRRVEDSIKVRNDIFL